VRKALYFPDGTRKKCLEPPDETLDEIHLLVRALVDQYNDDHYLSGVCTLSSCPHFLLCLIVFVVLLGNDC
jgi:hypothetical protein